MVASKNDLTIGVVDFIDHCKPKLLSGDYELNASFSISSKGKVHKDYKFSDTSEATQIFSVFGPRFKLSPKDIHSTYPPQGSSGDYGNVLPHVVFNRNTLPWERSPDTVDREVTDPAHPSWLALLLVSEDEEVHLAPSEDAGMSMGPRLQKETLNQFINYTDANSLTIKLEAGDDEKEGLNVIKIDKAFLENIAPTSNELRVLAHVRHQGEDAGAEHAVVVCNRLPKQGMRNTVYLVSMEGRYNQDGIDLSHAEDWVQLVVLKAWQFSCIKKTKGDFCDLLKKLDSGVLRLAKNANPDAEQFLGMGFVPLQHHAGNGKANVAWYHGPFVSGPMVNEISFPDSVLEGDCLIRYNAKFRMSDFGYAAAWELGRLLNLQNKKESLALYQWKRHHHQQSCEHAVCDEIAHVACLRVKRQYDFPSEWFGQLSQLENIPFNYLIPDEKMLPVESIRFFHVDPLWIDCLLDGAYSIGSSTDKESKYFSSMKPYKQKSTKQIVSGFLLRSDVVSGWPGIVITGLRKTNKQDADFSEVGKIGRVRYLSKNILVCFFEESLEAVDISLPPQTLHSRIPNEKENLQSLLNKQESIPPSKLASLLLADVDKVRFLMGRA